MNTRMTDSLDFHSSALLLRAERQKVLASNIANADTPNYASRDFDFRAALNAATVGKADASTGGALPAASTHAAHVRNGPDQAAGGARIDSTVLKYRVTEQPSLDGNSVDLDRERANFADNALRYEASLRFINGSVRTMLSAIRGE
jgi:flagellar basal-body rod protein FlgB